VLLADLEKNPDDVDLNFKLAKKYDDRYEPDQTMPYYQKVLELDPNNEKGHKVEATYEVAIFKARNEQDVEQLKAFIATEPDEEFLVNSYSTLASTYSRKKEMDNMVATYEEALAKFPDNVQLNFFYANEIFYQKMEDLYEKGLALNERVKTLDPEWEINAIYNLITYYANIGDKEKIIETFENAIADNPDSAGLKSSYASRINSLEIESKYDYGIELMENALAADPDSLRPNYTLGLLLQKKGDLEKAVAALKIVSEKYPTVKVYADALAKAEKELEENK